MKDIRIRTFIVLVTLLLATSLLSVGSELLFAAGPQYGGTLRICDQAEGTGIGFPPKYREVNYSTRQVAPAIERLLRHDKNNMLVPWLAEGFKEDAAAKVLTFTLRRGIKFHDGTDFNAEAVKWNLDQHRLARSQGADKFKSIDVIDDYTVRINLTEWDNTVTDNLCHNTGLIISPAAYRLNGEEWCQNHPVGTGPFKFVDWKKGVRIAYEKFNGYWQKGKPYLDRVEWSAAEDGLVRQLSLRTKEVDMIKRVAIKDIAILNKDGFVTLSCKVASGAYGLIPDSANPKSPFADLRVRQAAQYAINTETLVKTLLYGLAEPANQFVYKGSWAYNPSVVSYPYNPEKAKKLLAEAGYPNGFKTTLGYRVTPEWNEIFTAVQGYLKAVGIDAQLDPQTMSRNTQIGLQGGGWEGLFNNTCGGRDIAAFLRDRYSGNPGFYVSMLMPEDYKKAIQNAITAPNFETKRKWTQEVMKLMIDKYCLQILLFVDTDYSATHTYVHDHGFLVNPNINEWTPEDAWREP